MQSAIEIAWDPSAGQDLKIQAITFLGQFRVDPSAWQICLSLATRVPRSSDVVRHVALEIVNTSIQAQQLDPEKLREAKERLMGYIGQAYGGFEGEGEVDTASVQNKLTQTVTYLFTALYAEHWPTFFDDFLSLTGIKDGSAIGNRSGTSLYLRIISSVHDEIGDVLVPRSSEEQKRNNLLKDLVRERDAQKVARSWQEILSQWRDQNLSISDMCLKVIGHWASWIDIALVIDQALLNQIFHLIGRTNRSEADNAYDRVRNAAIETLTEIVGKKMPVADKIDMIVFLDLETIISQLIKSPLLHDLQASSGYDTDLAETVARLVNNTTYDIVKALDTESVEPRTRQRAEGLMQVFLPHLLRFLADEYDEICSTVIPSLTDLLTFLRKDANARGSPAPHYAAMLPPILNAIVLKMRYDETASWGNEDEQTDEAEFQELRKRLHVLQQAVAAVDEELYIDVIKQLILGIFERLSQQAGQIDWRDLDLALHEIFLFGDLAVKHGGLYMKGQPNNVPAETLIGMVKKMVESGEQSSGEWRDSKS